MIWTDKRAAKLIYIDCIKNAKHSLICSGDNRMRQLILLFYNYIYSIIHSWKFKIVYMELQWLCDWTMKWTISVVLNAATYTPVMKISRVTNYIPFTITVFIGLHLKLECSTFQASNTTYLYWIITNIFTASLMPSFVVPFIFVLLSFLFNNAILCDLNRNIGIKRPFDGNCMNSLACVELDAVLHCRPARRGVNCGQMTKMERKLEQLGRMWYEIRKRVHWIAWAIAAIQ